MVTVEPSASTVEVRKFLKGHVSTSMKGMWSSDFRWDFQHTAEGSWERQPPPFFVIYFQFW